jgi:hypothetical protein
MKFIPETSPRTKRFEHSLRMGHVYRSRLVAEDPPGRFHGDRAAGGGGRSGSEEFVEQRPTRRFAHALGVRPESLCSDSKMALVWGRLGEVGAFVDEADPRREHRVYRGLNPVRGLQSGDWQPVSRLGPTGVVPGVRRRARGHATAMPECAGIQQTARRSFRAQRP